MQFVGIRSEGGLLPLDILEQIAEEKLEGQKASAFGLPAGRRLTDEIARAWSDAQAYWSVFHGRWEDLPEKDSFGTTLTRERWVTRLLQDLLGYELTYQQSAVVVNGKNYAISHRAGSGEQAPPVHIEGFKIELDKRPESRRLSPQALLQEYLNNSEGHLWGIVTNGIQLRLLRDTSRTSRPTYLEFNLQSILEGNNFNEFALFYRLCHRTRLPQEGEEGSKCLLEKYFQTGIEQGGRVRDHLRDGVELALKILGTGFFQHSQNRELQERARSGKLAPPEYHRQLLRLVYRLLFLMVAEERRLILPDEPVSQRRWRIYGHNYSVYRLRVLAEGHVEKSSFADLWLSLKKTFQLFQDGDSNPLGIPPLNGDLFSSIAMRDLDGTHLDNDSLLEAMRNLSMFRDGRHLQRINYSALDVEELGSVYESLLDFQPVFEEQEGGLKFDLRVGSERKSTGSYYTRPELVRELIESALVPVMEDRLAEARKKAGEDRSKQREAQIQAILAMSVCDPACGSGHFLLAAARRLGRELAKIKTGEEEPTPKEFHLAVREVISHCIYGVDLNPLAVDLCKLALWLEGHWTGKPLSFLDHRIKCGNSLVGVLDPKVLEEGVPDDAFKPVTGDDKEVAKAFKKRNREERRGQPSLPFDAAEHVHDYAMEYQKLTAIPEETPSGVRAKADAYQTWRGRKDWWHDWTACNIWTSAFFVALTRFDNPSVPTHERLLRFVQRQDSQPQLAAGANALSEQMRFFHWRLEFPEVFEKGGFDVVLGNPPWETIQIEETTFFSAHGILEIEALAGAKRKSAIQRLLAGDVVLGIQWANHTRLIETLGKFFRENGRFELTARRKLNTYALFAELMRKLLFDRGFLGVMVPTGIATDEGTKEFFADIVETQSLAKLVGFENESFIFPSIHHSFKFCALTMGGLAVRQRDARFVFFCRHFGDLNKPEKSFSLSTADFALLNPNTHTCPIFRAAADAQLTKKICRLIPVLNGPGASWGVKYKQGLFNMTTDSGLFHRQWDVSMLPLYEAKMIHQFDHRFATFEGSTQANLNAGILPQCTAEQKSNPEFRTQPRYWVKSSDVSGQLEHWHHNWLVGFRDVTSSVVERTAIFSLLPRAAVGHNCPLVFFPSWPLRHILRFLGNANAIVLDYVARQKLGGNHLTFTVLNQLPVLPPNCYRNEDAEFADHRVLELVYTSSDLRDFANDVGYHQEAYEWDEEHRRVLRTDLDAYYAHLYGLTRDELRYILDPKDVFGEDFPSETFRVLKEREEKEFGEYRTRRLVLEAFDKLAESPRFKDEMPKRVSAFEVPLRQQRVALPEDWRAHERLETREDGLAR